MIELWPKFQDVEGYAFWYALLSLLFVGLERFRPARSGQIILRKQWRQDLFWWTFNGFYAYGILSLFTHPALSGFPEPVLKNLPTWAQFLLILGSKDFVEWWVHRALHRVPALWKIHRLHHSITTMDWAGNMRFHPLEIAVYRLAIWIPLGLVLVDAPVALGLAIVSTAMGHLNHANIDWSWGPLRKIFNGPRFHIHHHDRNSPHSYGCNYAIVFSLWDYWFGTAWTPEQPPVQLGFKGDEQYPLKLWSRMMALGLGLNLRR